MREADTDKDWEYFGKNDPYWAVITNERFRKATINDEELKKFFYTGEQYVAWVFGTIETHLDAGFHPSRALDFGCGVGRLVLPLARKCESVVGVDVSESMIREATVNVEAKKLTNVSLVQDNDQMSNIVGRFDLINSYIVFQHIPCERGQQLIAKLLDRLNEGGIGVLHLTYSKAIFNSSPFSVWPASAPGFSSHTTGRGLAYRLLALAIKTYRVARRRLREIGVGGRPLMQMNPYTLNPIFHCLQHSGIRRIYVEFTDHGGEYGVVLFFQKGSGGDYLGPVARIR